jgi:uracil-DNA glycosylase
LKKKLIVRELIKLAITAASKTLHEQHANNCRGTLLRLCDCHASTTKEKLLLTIDELNTQICNCRKCRLWQCAKHAVPGEGPQNARLMLVGQNPGAEEDKIGKPFMGRAGKFLNKVLAQNGINRHEIFITNIVKHVTPQNRKPLLDEVEACTPYLTKQINLVKPKVVVLMGAVAWQTPKVQGIEYVETVHPSAAMRFTKMRKRFLEDFKQLKKRVV